MISNASASAAHALALLKSGQQRTDQILKNRKTSGYQQRTPGLALKQRQQRHVATRPSADFPASGWQDRHTSGYTVPSHWNNELPFPEPAGYGAIKTALLGAARDGEIDVVIIECRDTDQNGNDIGAIPGTIDIDATYVSTASIRQFLKERNFHSDFFTPQQDPALPGYLDPTNECYAPKLAAAVDAWTVVTNEKRYETESTPKQLMEKWLRINAARYGLNKPDGKLNEEGITQITKIANWRPEGGASRTPGSKNPPTPRKAPKTR